MNSQGQSKTQNPKHTTNNTHPMNLNNLPTFRANIEVMKTPRFIDSVINADVILTFPTSPEWNPQIAYGTEMLQRIKSSGTPAMTATMCLEIDWATEEPEYLIALLRHIKGKCDLQ